MRLGPKPDFLERPQGTSFFLQFGKFPHSERQPIRLLESYGVAATAFNRFEDVGFMTGGTVGRNVYWRVTATNTCGDCVDSARARGDLSRDG